MDGSLRIARNAIFCQFSLSDLGERQGNRYQSWRKRSDNGETFTTARNEIEEPDANYLAEMSARAYYLRFKPDNRLDKCQGTTRCTPNTSLSIPFPISGSFHPHSCFQKFGDFPIRLSPVKFVSSLVILGRELLLPVHQHDFSSSVNVFDVNVNEGHSENHPEEGAGDDELIHGFGVELASENIRLLIDRRFHLLVFRFRPEGARLFGIIERIVSAERLMLMTPSRRLLVLVMRRRSGMVVKVCDAEIVFCSLRVGRQDIIGFLDREELRVQSRIGGIVVRVTELMIESKVGMIID